MRRWRVLPVFACLTASTAGQDAVARPDTPEQAAAKVSAAFGAKGAAALKALAEKDDPDPWFVADELCARGEFDAAESFAKAAPRVDVEKLPAYVASRRGLEDDASARKRLAEWNAALAAGDAEKALASAGDAAPVDVVTIRLAIKRGLTLRALRRFDEATAAFLRVVEGAEKLGCSAMAAGALYECGGIAYARRDFKDAQAFWERELVMEETRNHRAGVAATLECIGIVHYSLGDYAKALPCYGRALKLHEALDDRAGIARTLECMGVTYHFLGDYVEALSCHERAQRVQEELGDRAGIARTLGGIGNVHQSRGDYANALSYHERALKVQEELGDRLGIALALGNIGNVHGSLGDYAKALSYYGRSLKLRQELGERIGAAGILGNIGNVYLSLGDYAEALSCQESALKISEELGDRAGVARTLGNIGNIRLSLGEYPEALSCEDRALTMKEELGDRAGVAATLGNIGGIHMSLGDYAKALSYFERAQRVDEELGDRAGVALAIGNVGNAHSSLGDYAKALACQERALKLREELGDRALVASTLGNIGNVYDSLGDYAKALSYQERALKLKEELGDREGTVRTLGNIGSIHRSLGDYRKALSYQEEALRLSEELGNQEGVVWWSWNLAWTHLDRSAPDDAASFARRAVEGMAGLVRGLGEEQGAMAREQFSDVFAVGARAGARLRDPSQVAFFLESGRAGGLLEALGGREALRATAIPERLRAEEASVRAAESRAVTLLGEAVAGGDREEIKERSAELQVARDRLMEAIERIQREAKRGADLLYPRAKSLEEIRGGLREGEALILYGLFLEEPLALVVTADDARIVPLGQGTAIQDALRTWTASGLRTGWPESQRGLQLGSAVAPRTGPPESLRALGTLVAEPLGLDAKTTRVLVSPDGALAEVPFALLLPGREVAYVPSGSASLVLHEDAGRNGVGVLALGDPDFGAKADATALTVYNRGGNLTPLPGTREEAKAVAGTLLLGKDATEAGLRAALATRPRWRAVHLACHGLVDTERPMFSALALTPSGEDDGFLTVLDIFRMKVPADLAVLSACETAKGKVYRAEGIVGLVRAFMFAGAPRVIVSLWKVDDEATKALMVKFYGLWNPKDGSKGLPTATALRRAMEFVRDNPDHPDWKDPKYWAAWQLWGLPD